MTSLPATNLAAISFEEHIRLLKENFQGRSWVFVKINEWLQGEDGQFLILTGEPGIGKSAIAAQLIQTCDDIKAYHFCRSRDVETVTPSRVLRSLAAHLAENVPDYGLALVNSIKPYIVQVERSIQNVGSAINSQIVGVYIKELKPSDPQNELDILIRAPLAKLQEMYAEQQQKPPTLVILIDELDEAVTTTGEENLVTLLRALSRSESLPKWVRFVLTSRSDQRVLGDFIPLQHQELEKISVLKQRLDDIKLYVKFRANQEKLQVELQKVQNPEKLIDEIVKLSKGNFLYTKVLLNAIENKEQSLDLKDDLFDLPKEINDIYHNFLNRFKEDWENKYQPIFGILSVIQEPVTEEQLAKFTTIELEQVKQYLRRARQFLTEEKDKAGNKTYTIFHKSLWNYLLDRNVNTDFWCDAKKQNNLIVNYYKKPEQSWEEVDFKKVDKYGLLHLPKHLDAAGREEEFYSLLTASKQWMETKFRVFSSDTPYVDDLELAIDKFVDPLEPNELLTLVKLYTARLVVYQRASSYENTDLKTLVWLGRETETLSHAYLRADAEQKLDALLIIHNALQEKGQFNPTFLDEVLDKAKEVAQNEIEEASHLTDLLRNLTIALVQAERLDEAEELLPKIKNDTFEKVELLRELATVLVKNGDDEKASLFFRKAEELVGTIKEPSIKIKALLYLATNLVKNGDDKKASSLFREAEKLVETIKELSIEKIEVLLNFATALVKAKDDEKASLFFRKAEELVAAIKEPSIKREALLYLTTALAKDGDDEKASLLFREAEKANGVLRETKKIASVENDWERIEILLIMAILQAQVGFAQEAKGIFDEVEDFSCQQEDKDKRANMLRKLAEALAQAKDIKRACAVFSKAMKVPNAFEEGWEEAELRLKFAEILVQAGFAEEAHSVFKDTRRAIDAIKGVGKEWVQAKVLRKLAAVLVQAKLTEQAGEVFIEAEKLAFNTRKDAREQALSKWAVVLSQADYPQKATLICTDPVKFAEVKQQMDECREHIKQTRKIVKDLSSNESQVEEYKNLAAEINQARNSTEVRRIADAIRNSTNLSELKDLGELAIFMVMVKQITTAIKVIRAVEDDLEQKTQMLSDFTETVAGLGYFKEALSILELKNSPSRFLDNLAKWIYASEEVEQKLEILKETTRIFGWIYPDWGQIYDQLLCNSIGEVPIFGNPILKLEDKELLNKRIQDNRELQKNGDFITIPPEQAQRLEACIQEVASILYNNIPKSGITLEGIEKIVREQIILRVSTKIISLHQSFE
ncbi:MAG: AAA family ATPase [Nostoc sp.]|uniref:AAA family ATPase n=1 Tax=Nostoc sp. TaxID=1180 RepID=UPI002FF655CC